MTTAPPTERCWLVAHDFSPHSEAALEAAVSELQELSGPAKLAIVHVLPQAVAATGELSTLGPSFAAMNRKAHEDAGIRLAHIANGLAARVEAVGKRLWITPVLRSGAPVTAILEEARRRNVERIVVGTQGRRGLERLLLGSVAELVVRRSHVPVLVVHEEGTRELRAGTT